MLRMADLCEHFPGRLPSEIQVEMDRQPIGYLEEMLEAKCYKQAYQMTEAADTAEARARLPKTPFFALVSDIDFALAEEERQKRKQNL